MAAQRRARHDGDDFKEIVVSPGVKEVITESFLDSALRVHLKSGRVPLVSSSHSSRKYLQRSVRGLVQLR